MKEITFKNNRSIRTPWLRIGEAAAYCGLSRFAFSAHGSHLPHGGNNRTRIYHVDVLDDWIANRFDEDKETEDYPKVDGARTIRLTTKDGMEIVNPQNGKVSKVKE